MAIILSGVRMQNAAPLSVANRERRSICESKRIKLMMNDI